MRAILRYGRTEFGKAVRSDYEGKRISLRRNEVRMLSPRPDARKGNGAMETTARRLKSWGGAYQIPLHR